MLSQLENDLNKLTPTSIHHAYTLIEPHIHSTPVLTNKTLNSLVSTPQTPESLLGTAYEGCSPASPKINFFFKCENYQRIGAFKVRGAFHAVMRSIEREGRGRLSRGGGNHAQALALAASTFNVPACIIMPSTSAPSKIASTQSHKMVSVMSGGSTFTECEAVVAEVQRKTNAIVVPSYDHADIITGQGTTALELSGQYAGLVAEKPGLSVHGSRSESVCTSGCGRELDAVITPVGGGGLNAGVATFFSDSKTLVFGAEPSFQGADDCRQGLERGKRLEAVETRTIADGLRSAVGKLNWEVISDGKKVKGVYSVTEEQIRQAMRLVLERMKVVVEPSAVVGLAVCLFNEDFRGLVEREGERRDGTLVLS
ncbi:putative serine racemase [Penicillium canescens]|nr:putative serine racemase [Penicillium canescens]